MLLPEKGVCVALNKRSIPLCIIFCFITCGVYALYWLYTVTDELNSASGNYGDLGGGIVLLLTIVTFGLFGIYWAYTAGGKVAEIRAYNGADFKYYPILFPICWFFGLSIVVLAITQDTLNKIG